MTAIVRSDPDVAAVSDSLAADVARYLTATPRQLPSRALYDTLGSALFDAICQLPWYPVTRAERRLIAAHRAAIAEGAGQPERLVELGCGNGDKLALLLGPSDAPSHHALGRVDLVDVSASALSAAARLIGEGRDLSVLTHQQRYEDGLAVAAASRALGERLGVLFLGSNIGNFDPPGANIFLGMIRRALHQGDALIIGADLIKPERDLLLAYDDPLGVTAAFNKNLLVRINREMGANFDIVMFDHRAVWNADQSRVEMHLVSRGKRRVDIPAAGVSIDLRPGETIWTESSYKYEVQTFDALLRRAGFTPARHWIDREGQFLLVVARATG
jgi:dimethylhistidine N-methyltransferase